MGTLLYILLLWSILSYFETIPLLNDYQFIVKNQTKTIYLFKNREISYLKINGFIVYLVASVLSIKINKKQW